MTMININLLPPELRGKNRGFHFSKGVILGTVVGAGFIVLLTGLTFVQAARLSGVKAEIVQARAEVERLQDDIKLVDRLEDVKTKILRRMAAIESLDRDRGFWVSNVEDILAVIPDYLWLSDFHREQTPKGHGRGADTVQTSNNYFFDGYCFTISSLANLIMNLKDSPRFTNIKLDHAALEELESRRVYKFQVICELEPLSSETSGFEDRPTEDSRLGARYDDTEADDAWVATDNWNQPAREEADEE